MNKKEDALNCFSHKFNCAQSVFAAFADDLGIDRDTALKTGAGFGGGMRCGEVCGALTGALMALGNKYGSCKPDDLEGKRMANQKASELISRFKEKNGTYICKELLGYNPGIPEDLEKINALGLFDTVCRQAITDAVEITEEMLAQK